MNLRDVYSELSEETKDVEAAGILIVVCSEGQPLIYRTMGDEVYKNLLEVIKDVKPTATMQ